MGAPVCLSLWRDGAMRADAGGSCCFLGLVRRQYSLKAGVKE